MRHFALDRIVELEPGTRAVGLRSVTLAEDAFEAHFPGNPVFPGVYLLEGMAQTAGVLLTRSTDGKCIALMASIDRAKFSSFARPGDTVRFEVELEHRTDEHAQVQGLALVEGRSIAKARISFKLVPATAVVWPEFLPAWRRMLDVWCGEFPGDDDA
jgi:3-hydroxyacyl-[acyl-carrier-protein] dehydratase